MVFDLSARGAAAIARPLAARARWLPRFLSGTGGRHRPEFRRFSQTLLVLARADLAHTAPPVRQERSL